MPITGPSEEAAAATGAREPAAASKPKTGPDTTEAAWRTAQAGPAGTPEAAAAATALSATGEPFRPAAGAAESASTKQVRGRGY